MQSLRSALNQIVERTVDILQLIGKAVGVEKTTASPQFQMVDAVVEQPLTRPLRLHRVAMSRLVVHVEFLVGVACAAINLCGHPLEIEVYVKNVRNRFRLPTHRCVRGVSPD